MIDRIRRLALEAGEIMKAHRGAAAHIKEGHYNLVTDADIETQAFLQKGLREIMPAARFYAEEQENAPLTDAPTFVVDPIDGTANFYRQRRDTAVSIGYLVNKQPVMGVICRPFDGELFWAVRGEGAFLNGERIHVSGFAPEKAIVAFGTAPYYEELADRTFAIARRLQRECGDVRRTGSAAVDLSDVACGRADIFFELRLCPWDVAAGALLVTEAGGIFGSVGHEKPWFSSPSGVYAANPACLATVRNAIGE